MDSMVIKLRTGGRSLPAARRWQAKKGLQTNLLLRHHLPEIDQTVSHTA